MYNESTLSHDAFLGGLLTITQPKKGYRAGTDAVLLGASCPAKSHEIVIDLGAGVGTAGLCVNARMAKDQHPLAKLYLVEKQTDICALTQKNSAQNELVAKVITANITENAKQRAASGLSQAMAHHVIMNPPYYKTGSHQRADESYRQSAHMLEEDTSLELWIKTAAWCLKSKGSLSIIYPSDGLTDILTHMQNRFGNIAILPIAPRENEIAKRVLIQGFRDSKAPLRLLSPLVMHDTDGGYTPQVEDILRNGSALIL